MVDFGKFGPPPAPGSRGHIDALLTNVIAHQRPACVTVEAVKRELAIHWLRTQLPRFGFFARARWLWALARTLLLPW